MPLDHKHDWIMVGCYPDRYTRTAYYKCSVCGKIEKRTEWWVDLQPKMIGSHGGKVCGPEGNGASTKKGGPAVN